MPKNSDDYYIDRLSHLGIITGLGERDKKTTPGFLSTNKIECPRCGRMDYGNVDSSRVVMCSLCLMNEVFKVERSEKEMGPPLAVKQRGIKVLKKIRRCERCGDSFKGRSNRQRFCGGCQKWASNEKAADRMRQVRKGSVVTV